MSGFIFGSPTTQTGTKTPGLTFGTFGSSQSTSGTVSTFSFGSPSTTSAPNSFSPMTSLATTSTTIPTSTAPQPLFGLPAFGNKPATPISSPFGLGTPSTTTTVPAFGTLTTTTTASFPFLASTTSANATGTTPSFGFGLTSKPSTTTTATTVAPTNTLSFGTLATTTNAPATITFGFGLKSTPTTSTATTTSSFPFTLTSTQASSGGLTFGTPTITTTAPTSGSSLTFGNFGMAKLGSTTAPATTATTTSGFSFGSLIKTSDSSPATSTATISSTVSTTMPSTTATATPVTSTATGNATLSSTTPSLTYRQLEEMVNKWTYELDEQSRNFSAELNRLNKADRVLISNAEKISDLHAKVEACKAGQSRIEQELEFVESQQRALEDLLEPLEQAAADLPPSQQHADAEREAIFQMCINTDLELGQLLGELREMAERVNAVTADLEATTTSGAMVMATDGSGAAPRAEGDGSGAVGVTDKTSNVIGQVTRILNSHMHSLSWLSQNTQELMEKMKFLSAA